MFVPIVAQACVKKQTVQQRRHLIWILWTKKLPDLQNSSNSESLVVYFVQIECLIAACLL